MVEEQNVQQIQTEIEHLNARNLKVLADAEQVSQTASIFTPLAPGEKAAFHSPREVQKALYKVNQSFPDFHVEVLELVSTKTHVTVRWQARGTHRGEDFYDFRATGEEIELTGNSVIRFDEKGESTEWHSFDSGPALKQLAAAAAAY